MDVDALTGRVGALIASATGGAPHARSADDVFNDVAMALFEAQRRAFPVVDRYQARRGPASHWTHIAPLPIAAFKHAELYAGDVVARRFESSGTSGAARSVALFSEQGLALMAASIDANAGRRLFPDGRATRILVLTPPPEAAPALIMVAGMARLIERYGLPGSRFLVGPAGLDGAALHAALRQACEEGVPVTLCGASFSFVHLLDALGAPYALPPGSRTLDAGGFKGRSRTVTPQQLSHAIGQGLGVPPTHVVNLLGMTELASQLWEAHLGGAAPKDGSKVDAPWTRSRVLDPLTLQEVPVGGVGLLAHLDLCNVERPFAVLTDDLGERTATGFRVLGRAAESDAKGCSLTLEELLSR